MVYLKLNNKLIFNSILLNCVMYFVRVCVGKCWYFVGLEPGSVVVTECAVDALLRPKLELVSLNYLSLKSRP